MKMIYYLYVCIVAVGFLVLLACTKDYIEPQDINTDSNYDLNSITVAEAKEFFEKEYEQFLSRSGGKRERHSKLNPGDFSPKWENAIISEDSRLGSVDIPIHGEKEFRAIRSQFRNGRAKAYSVPMYQKLIVIKDKISGRLSQYILTLVPTQDFHNANKGNFVIEKFLNSGDKSDYSGIAAYHTIGGNLIRVDEYENGLKTKGVNTLSRKFNKAEKFQIVKSIIGDVGFTTRATTSLSRFDGESDGVNWTWEDLIRWLDDYLNDPNTGDFYWDVDQGEPPWSDYYNSDEDNYDHSVDLEEIREDLAESLGIDSDDIENLFCHKNDGIIEYNGKEYESWTVVFGEYDPTIQIWIDENGDRIPDTKIYDNYYGDPGDPSTDGGGNNNNGNPSDEETGTNNNDDECSGCGSTSCDGSCDDDGDGDDPGNNGNPGNNIASNIAQTAKVSADTDKRKYGASSPNVDCSKFTQEVAKSEGKEIPRTSSQQKAWFQANGTFVTSVSQIRVGDFAFWARDGTNVSHTGIITETSPGIVVVHATVNGNREDCIMENNVDSNGNIQYWTHTFIGAGRFK